jgi:hypothetical protein
VIYPEKPDEVRPRLSLKRLKDAIKASAQECVQIKKERRALLQELSRLDERAKKIQHRNRDLTCFSAWLRGKSPMFPIRSVRLALIKEFWSSAIDRLAEIADG